MNKLVCLVVCALVAGSFAQGIDLGPTLDKVQLVPMVASLCTTGCPLVCDTVNKACTLAPGFQALCATLKTECDSACTQTCECIPKCGPTCDEAEQTCLKFGFPFQGVICPVAEMGCDAACVASCPQKALFTVLTKIYGQTSAALQAFVTSMLKSVGLVA